MKLSSNVMPHLLLRDSSAPLPQSFAASPTLSLSTSVLLFPQISDPCLSTLARSMLMSLHLYNRLCQG
ncbi:hypothetical protein Bca101_059457 [Brassica carinata]